MASGAPPAVLVGRAQPPPALADGTVWFADPTFGILMPNQGSIVEPELDHRSVYRFDSRTGELRRMADFEQPDGFGFSPNDDVLLRFTLSSQQSCGPTASTRQMPRPVSSSQASCAAWC